MIKWILGAIVLVVVAAAAWWGGWVKMPEQTVTPAPQEQAVQTQTEPDNGLSAQNDTSDAAIAQDTAALDAQIKASQTDSADIASAMNDKPVSQSY